MKQTFSLLISIVLFFIAYKSSELKTHDTIGQSIFFIVCGLLALYIGITGKELPKVFYKHPRINRDDDKSNIPLKIYLPIIAVLLSLLALGVYLVTKEKI